MEDDTHDRTYIRRDMQMKGLMNEGEKNVIVRSEYGHPMIFNASLVAVCIHIITVG